MNKQKLSNEEVVHQLMLAMQKNDAKMIKSLFDTEASQAYGDGPFKKGKDFFKWLQSDIIDRKGHVDHPIYNSEGTDHVIVKGQYSSEGYTNKADFLFEVKEGKIQSWQMRY